MLQVIKQSMPKDQQPLFWGVMVVWLCSFLYLLFSGGKLALIMVIITTIITAYLLLLARWSGINDITGKRVFSNTNELNRLETGDTFHLKTFFKIPGFWPIPYVLIKDQLIHHQLGTETYESSFVPDFYRSGEIDYSIYDLKRGSYRFGETECSTGDLLNLFEHKSSLQLPSEFKVYPKTIRIKDWPYISTFRKAISISSSTIYKKETTEINGVREYIHGDRLSKVHWNASAKTGDLKSKEFTPESVTKILIIIDQYKLFYNDDKQFELAVSIAASIIRYVSKQQMPIGLFSPGKQVSFYQPKPGVTYSHRLEEHLLYVGMDGNLTIQKALLDQRLKRLQGSLVIIITPDASDQLFHRLKWLKKMNLHPCYIWLSSMKNPESEEWERRLKGEQITFYQIDSLAKLPVALERGRP
ncbi:DUF58 domain-containing protein [Aquibacillus halophilus]|uniref:DUF58 domain-containing protein n=1 Tax=Aquibacillus halophilus TaxID=930132 RepID=A0A6A8DCN2_9BACI|nr:DUF58 domain-containing protein [Aquibacillus halophilus]MRH43433.1 DUF58 domain-containing protein [Aquibacillus halophilus]